METNSPTVSPASYAHKWRSFFPIGLSLFTNVLSMTMVFVALSAIAEDFEITLKLVSWVVIIESLVLSALIMPMGRVGDMFGWKRIHVIGLLLFGLGALSTGLAPSFMLLIGARLIMAVGGAMIQSTQTALAIASFPPEEQGTAIGSQSTAVAIGGCCGPIVAGLTLQVLPWEAMFFMLVPLSLLTALSAMIFIDTSVLALRQSTLVQKFDWGGAVLSALAVTVLVTLINNPIDLSVTSGLFVGAAATVVVLLVLFCFWELRASSPMLDLRMFNNLNFATSVAARGIGFMASTTVQLLPPILLISVRGMSSGIAGFVLVLNFLGMAIASTSAGRLSDKFNPKPFAVFGFVLLIISTIWMSFGDAKLPLWFLMGALMLNGLALGFWNVPNQGLLMGALPSARLGVGGAFSNLTRNVGNVTGQAVITAIVVAAMAGKGFDIPLNEIANTPGSGEAFIQGWKHAFWLASALALAGLFVTLFTRTTRREKSVSEDKHQTVQNLIQDEVESRNGNDEQAPIMSGSTPATKTIVMSFPIMILAVIFMDWIWRRKHSDRTDY